MPQATATAAALRDAELLRRKDEQLAEHSAALKVAEEQKVGCAGWRLLVDEAWRSGTCSASAGCAALLQSGSQC